MNEKIAIVVASDLKDWQKLNVVAFLASGVAIELPELHGRPFVTASQSRYLPFLKRPMLIYKADDAAEMRRAFVRAKERKLHVGIYTRPLFATKDEEGNVSEIAKLTDDQQELVGIVVCGEAKLVGKAIDGLKFHP